MDEVRTNRRDCLRVGWVVALFLFRFGESLAYGQEAATTFNQLQSQVTVGDTVTVRDSLGRDIEGTIIELSSTSIALMADKTRTDFLAADVETVSCRDSRWNGTLWGLAAGGLAGVLLDHSIVDEYGREDVSVGASVALIASIAGLGGGVGFAADALIKGRRILYSRSPTSERSGPRVLPIWNIHRKGIVVSLSLGARE